MITDQDILSKTLGAIVTLLTGGIIWLVRTVFTNSKRVAILESKMENQERLLREVRDKQDETYRIIYDHFKTPNN